jgi:hypothetical protein
MMMSDQETSAAARLETVRREVENWRKRRPKKGPRPTGLWAEAILLTRELGVTRVADSLGMNHGALSRRVELTKVLGPSRVSKPALSHFVDCTPAASATVASAPQPLTVIELTSAAGERLTLRVSHQVDLTALVATFQARR